MDDLLYQPFERNKAVERGIFSCGRLDPEAKVIPHDRFLPKDKHGDWTFKADCGLKFVQSSPTPFNVEWLPFFKELSIRIASEIRKTVKRPFCSKFTFYFFVTDWNVIGPLYEYFDPLYYMLKGEMAVSNHYTGRFDIFDYQHYSYAMLSASSCSKFKWVQTAFWIRWKSKIPGKDYISPYDGSELTEDNIEFEICSELPDDVRQHFREKIETVNYKKTEKIDVSTWIKSFDDDEIYNFPKSFVPKKCPTPFETEYGKLTDYPDTTFIFCLKNAPDKDAVDHIEKTLDYCARNYDVHDVMKISVPEFFVSSSDADKLVAFAVDFGGSSPPRALKSLVRKLQNYDLKVEKLTVI